VGNNNFGPNLTACMKEQKVYAGQDLGEKVTYVI